MYQTIHEVQDRFDGYAKNLGDCTVYFIFAGSTTCNPQFMVRLYQTGDMRMIDQNDVKVYGNPQTGEPLTPFIPDDWKVKEKENPKTYTCMLCGRNKFTEKSAHNCVGGYRKRGIIWKENK